MESWLDFRDNGMKSSLVLTANGSFMTWPKSDSLTV